MVDTDVNATQKKYQIKSNPKSAAFDSVFARGQLQTSDRKRPN